MAKPKNETAGGTTEMAGDELEVGPKMPTGRFVATTPLQIMHPEEKRVHVVQIGEVLPDGFSKKELKYWFDNGTITHEYKDS